MKKKSARKSAFFNPCALIGFGLCLMGLLLALLAYTAYPGASLLAQRPGQQVTEQPGWHVVASYHNDVSPSLREIASRNFPSSGSEHEASLSPRIPFNHAGTDRPDPVVQNERLNLLGQLASHIPAPILNFDGIPGGTGAPDTNGAAGATQYVQLVNRAFQVFDKNTGT